MSADDKSMMLPDLVPDPSFDVATLSDLSAPEFTEKYNLLVEYISQLTELKKTVDNKIKTVLEAQYNETGDSSCEYNGRRYTYIPPTTRVTVDTKRLQAEQPDVYAKYARVSRVSAVVKSALRKSEDQ